VQRMELCLVVEESLTIISKNLPELKDSEELLPEPFRAFVNVAYHDRAEKRQAFCDHLFFHRQFDDCFLALPSVLLHSFSKHVGVTDVPALGNANKRFNFEYFLTHVGSKYRSEPYNPYHYSFLRYPGMWSPQRVCGWTFKEVLPEAYVLLLSIMIFDK
jgi:hypothetical protein